MKRTFSAVILTLLLTSMLTLAFNVQPVRAYGLVYIMSDGSVSPSSAPIYRNGDIYTLTADISTDTNGILIQKSDVVLDGSGHTLGGSGASNSAGIWGDWGYGSNVIISNLKVRGYTCGIGFVKSSSCAVQNCKVTDCWEGVSFTNSLNCVASRNNLTGCDICLWNCEYGSVSGNIIGNCSDGIMIAGACSNNIIARNTISGCNRWYGIMVQSGSSNNSIIDNTLTGSGGISFRNSSGNKVYYNNFTSIIQAESINAINSWDDSYSSGGNYWSDYLARYPNATEIDSSGIWNMPYIIDANNADHYPLVNQVTISIHDVAVDSVLPLQTNVTVGDFVPVNIFAVNKGTQTETFSVTAYFGSGKLGFDTATTTLDAYETRALTMIWNTTAAAPSVYQIGAYATQVLGETNLTNNDCADGTVTVAVRTRWDPHQDSYSQSNYVSAWSGGNCYGLSSTEILYFMHYVLGNLTFPFFPAQNPPATSTSELKLPTNPGKVMNNASLAVMFHQVYDPSNAFIISPVPSENLEYYKLVKALESGTPALLLLGGSQGYHAVVAWAIEPLQNGTVNVKVSDPNVPQQVEVANYNPSTQTFSYNAAGLSFNEFEVATPETIQTSWIPQKLVSGIWTPLWQSWEWQVAGYNIVFASKPIEIRSPSSSSSPDSTIIQNYDYFTKLGDSGSFVDGISGSAGIEEGTIQVYAIPSSLTYDIVDPSTNQSTIMITRVENVSGQLTWYGYLLNVTTMQGLLEYTVTPSGSGLFISTEAEALNASVVFCYATPQNHSTFQYSNVAIGAMQAANFTVINWQMLNNTSPLPVTLIISPIVSEFPTTMILPFFMIATLLAALTWRRKRAEESGRPAPSTENKPRTTVVNVGLHSGLVWSSR